MNMALQTQVKAISIPASVSTPVQNRLLQRKCPNCSTHSIDGEHEDYQKKRLSLQRRATNETGLPAVPSIVHDVLRTPGETLDRETRAFMESRFGHDFSQVRVHTDTKAAESARAVNALAYTVGRDVVLGAGQHEPRTSEGRRLLGHELTHVVQQRNVSKMASADLQPKLTVAPANDPYEQEADRVAEQVMRMAFAESLEVPSKMPSARIQRRCPRCIGSQTGNKEDALIHAKEIPNGIPEVAPELETQISTIHGGGQPLPESVRAFFEPRFGYDFSHVRIHNDAHASELAKTLNAYAFTLGSDIVFGAGKYAPQSSEFKQLLAHELTHVMQQGANQAPTQTNRSTFGQAGTLIQRQPIPVQHHKAKIRSLGDVPEDAREKTQQTEARLCTKPDMHYTQTNCPKEGVLLPDTTVTVTARNTHGGWLFVEAPPIKALGNQKFGWVLEAFVEPLSVTAPTPKQTPPPITPPPTPESSPQHAAPAWVCGPDATSKINESLSNLISVFGEWDSDRKKHACTDLITPPAALVAWDIIDLHNSDWIHELFRPECATKGAKQPCGHSIQVGKECYYAGSANYVVFGVMCKLCHDYLLLPPKFYPENPDPYEKYTAKASPPAENFTKEAMLSLIALYKKTAHNFTESQQWAGAGYDGWPSGGTPPAGDRSNCSPTCPKPLDIDLKIRWCPHLNCSLR